MAKAFTPVLLMITSRTSNNFFLKACDVLAPVMLLMGLVTNRSDDLFALFDVDCVNNLLANCVGNSFLVCNRILFTLFLHLVMTLVWRSVTTTSNLAWRGGALMVRVVSIMTLLIIVNNTRFLSYYLRMVQNCLCLLRAMCNLDILALLNISDIK